MKISNYGRYKREAISEFDRYLYRQLYELINTNSNRLAAYLPEFIVYEAMAYFLKRKSYEEYNVIKGYLLLNPKKMIKITRDEWMRYGWKHIVVNRKNEKEF